MITHNDIFKRPLLTGLTIILGLTASLSTSAQTRPYPLLKRDTLSHPVPLTYKAPLSLMGNREQARPNNYTYGDYTRENSYDVPGHPSRNNHFRWNDITAVTEMALKVYILFR